MDEKIERIEQRRARKTRPEVIHTISPVIDCGFASICTPARKVLLSLFPGLAGTLSSLSVKVLRQDGEPFLNRMNLAITEYYEGEVNMLIKVVEKPYMKFVLDKKVHESAAFTISFDGLVEADEAVLEIGLLVWVSTCFYPHSNALRRERS